MYRARFNPVPPKGTTLQQVEDPAKPSAWVKASVGALAGPGGACIVLLGGCDLLGFRLRLAQSRMRADALPGFFSHVALALTGTRAHQLELWHVPLCSNDHACVPARNGIEPLPLEALDRPGLYPNLAVLHAPVEDVVAMRSAVRNLQGARLSEDLVTPIPAWLAYVWQCAGSGNPLEAGVGLPGAMFVEACYAAARLDIMPGVTQRIATPEALWQAAKWWSGSVGAAPVTGRYRLRQPEAAATFDASPRTAKLPRNVPTDL